MFNALRSRWGAWEPVEGTRKVWDIHPALKLDVAFPELSTLDYSEIKFPKETHFGHDDIWDILRKEIREENEIQSNVKLGLNVAFGCATAYAFSRALMVMRRTTLRNAIVALVAGPPAETTQMHKSFKLTFNNTMYDVKENKFAHSHPRSVAARHAANEFIDAFITMSGFEPYRFQTSQAENAGSEAGARDYYWAKDLCQEWKADEIAKKHIVTMVDVDFYVDMPKFLAENATPVILYTVQPECAGEDLGETSFTLSDNMINWSVKGGARYSHCSWDYSTDWFTVTDTRFGIPYRTVLYDVQTRRVERHRQLVMLTPLRVCYGLSAIVAWFIGRPLQQCKFSASPGFVKVRTWDADNKRHTSIARSGTNSCVTIPDAVYNSLLATRRISPKNTLNLYQVKALTKNVLGDDTDVACPILTDYLNNSTDTEVTVINVVDRPNMVTFAFAPPAPTDKPILEAFGRPLVPPAFVPVNNEDSSKASIIGRVIKTQEAVKKMDVKTTPFKQRIMGEFVKFLVPEVHKHVPLDFDAIVAKQSKPGQKRDLDKAGFMSDMVSKIVTTFLKAEAYGKPTDTRNITTFQARPKIDYAGFMYPIMDHLKQYDFYAFGKEPKKVAERVAHIAGRAKSGVTCADIHRMDGHVNAFLRTLERAVGLRFFHPDYHAEFLKAHDAHIGNRGVTTFGNWYEQGDTRGSGEMGTSAWNTVITLYLLYLCFRMAGLEPKAAWQKLLDDAMAGGDDSVVADADELLLVRAAYNIGFILKTPTIAVGEPGVNFLARVYGPDVWNGDPTSMCDIKRQMEKFHLCARAPISPEQKLYEKALSFSYTDSNTPLIGAFVNKILSLTRGFETTHTLVRYGDEWDVSVQYPNDKAQWMWEVVYNELPLVRVDELINYINAADSLKELLEVPAFYDEGREFTYEDWDPSSGMLISRTFDIIEGRKLDTKKPKVVKEEEKPVVKAPTIEFVEGGGFILPDLNLPSV